MAKQTEHKLFPLVDIVFPDSKDKISEWSFIGVEPTKDVRCYYAEDQESATGKVPGFRFYVVESTSSDGNGFDDPTVTVECLFYGIAGFDGIRHLYMGDKGTENLSYLNYPNVVELASALTVLRSLETKLL